MVRLSRASSWIKWGWRANLGFGGGAGCVSVLVTDLENLGMEDVAFFDVEDTEGTFFDTLLLVIDVEGAGAVMDAVTGAAVDAAGVTVEEILLRFVDADLEGGICFLVAVAVVFRFLPLPSTLTFVSICMILNTN